MATGTEILLKSMGLGDAMKAVNELVASGAINKILAFSDNVEGMRRTLAAIQERMDNGHAVAPCPYCRRIIDGDDGNASRVFEGSSSD